MENQVVSWTSSICSTRRKYVANIIKYNVMCNTYMYMYFCIACRNVMTWCTEVMACVRKRKLRACRDVIAWCTEVMACAHKRYAISSVQKRYGVVAQTLWRAHTNVITRTHTNVMRQVAEMLWRYDYAALQQINLLANDYNYGIDLYIQVLSILFH